MYWEEMDMEVEDMETVDVAGMLLRGKDMILTGTVVCQRMMQNNPPLIMLFKLELGQDGVARVVKILGSVIE